MRLSLVLCLSKANVARCCNAWWRAACITVIHDYWYTFISLFGLNSYKAFYTREEPPTVKLNAFRCLPWTCTYTALCPSLFTYAGHHNNSLAKSYFNQTVIWSWPGFDTLDHSTNAISLFWTSFFSFLRLEFHFVAPESARKKNRTDGRRADAQNLAWSGGSGNHSEDP